MKKLLIMVLMCAAGFGAYLYGYLQTHQEPLHPTPYIIIYGREACGYCQQYEQDISGLNMRFFVESVDDMSTASVLHKRMRKAGLDTGQYNLPVLDVNGRIFIRPPMEEVTKAYNSKPLDFKFITDLSNSIRSITLKRAPKYLSVRNNKNSPSGGKIRLEGIGGGNRPVAIINGEAVKVSGTVAGWKVIEINERSVKLRNEKGAEIVETLQ
jgi:glutaredoxin